MDKVKDIVNKLNDPTILNDDFAVTFNGIAYRYRIVSDDGFTQIVIEEDFCKWRSRYL